MKKNKSILRRNLILSLIFGMGMGVIFPVYASFFVDFKSPVMKIFFVAGCIVAGLVVGIVSFLINNRIVVRMAKRVVSVIQSINKGDQTDFSALDIDSDDALGILITQFKETLQQYNDTLQIRKQTAKTAFNLGKQFEARISMTSESIKVLNRTVELICSAVGELGIQGSHMEKNFEQVNKSTLLNVSNVIELFASINEFGKTIFTQSETVEQLLSAIGQVERQIGSESETQEKIDLIHISVNLEREIQTTIDTSANIFAKVRKNLEAIGGIAERTNILSINASIESARLGKAGAGFRVISTNIKQLAGEVHAFIETINREMDNGENKLSAVSDSLMHAINSQVKVVDSIRTALQAISERSGSVTTQTALMQENRSHIDELLLDVKNNMQNLKEIVINTRLSLSQVLETSNIINTGITTLTEKSTIIELNEKQSNLALGEFTRKVQGLSIDDSKASAESLSDDQIQEELESIDSL